MNTTADKYRDQAVENVRKAIKALAEIVVNECEGSDDFTDTFKSKLKAGMETLITVRDSLS